MTSLKKYMKSKIAVLYGVLTFVCCVEHKDRFPVPEIPKINTKVDDSYLNPDRAYEKGDVRRYGLHPGSIKLGRIDDVLELGEKGVPICFPKGYYPISIVISGRSNLNITFEDVVIGGGLQIINNAEKASSKILLKGKVAVLDKVFIRKSNNISFDTLLVKTDILKNIYNHKNRGVSIYAGTETVNFNYLSISNTGGLTDNHYKNTAAALQIHGWNNNPKNVYIKDLLINNSDRTGYYITGNNHRIEKFELINFGLGSKKNISTLEDASPGEENFFSAIWINRCNNCVFDTISIRNPLMKGDYSIRLDEGVYEMPTFVHNISIKGGAKELPIFADKLTNVLVKNEY